MKTKYIDLSQVIRNGESTYKGYPETIICDYISRSSSKQFYTGDTSFQIDKIEMIGNSGTYLDSPFHRYEHGADIAKLQLKQLVDLPGLLIHAPSESNIEIDASYFQEKDIKGKAVLVHTGWSKHWQTDRYHENHSFLTHDAAEYLKEQGAVLVGIDSYNIDDTRKKNDRPVHSVLLHNNILIVEHLTNLHSLSNQAFTFTAVPPKLENVGTFPVRAFAKIID